MYHAQITMALLVVGYGYITGPFNNDKNAWRWTSLKWISEFEHHLFQLYYPIMYELFYANSISSDGRYIAGFAGDGINQTGLAYILDTQSNLHITEPTNYK